MTIAIREFDSGWKLFYDTDDSTVPVTGSGAGGGGDFLIDNFTKLHENFNVSDSTELVINDDGDNKDLRVEGDTDSVLLFVDAGNDRVGIGTPNPAYKFCVNGTTMFSGLVGNNDFDTFSTSGSADSVSNTTDTTLVTTTGAHTVTLADGVVGQMKTVILVSDGGDMSLVPTNKGGYSTITFADAGDSVLLKFINSKWYIIGKGGVGAGPVVT